MFGPVGKRVRARTEGDAQELYEKYRKSADPASGWSRRQMLLRAAGVVSGSLS